MDEQTAGLNGSPSDGVEDDDLLYTESAFGGLQAENAELKDRLLRLAADMENLKRRAERESNDARAYAIQKFARDLLGVSDNLARALQHAPRDDADQVVKNFVVGVELTEKELTGAFERNGLKRVAPAAGEKFDPNFHQAMMEQPSETVGGGAVISTLQPGYELFGRIVRPAMVVVAAKGSGPRVEPNPYAAAEGGAAGASVDTSA
jgi:molecular chaperone GrpE